MAALTRAVNAKHPLYVEWFPTWDKLRNAYEGTGGFLDGTYLVAHPREWLDYDKPNPSKPGKKLKARRAIARYENVAELLVQALAGALFRESPARLVGDPKAEDRPTTPIEDWWANCDDKGTDIDDFLPQAWISAAVFGHTFLVMDLPERAEGGTAADQARPYLRHYTPLDVLDWLEDDEGTLTAVRLLEALPRLDFSTALTTVRWRVRELTTTAWALYDDQGTKIDGGDHGLGTLPVVQLFAKRRALFPTIGASVLKDPQLYIDLYNLTSELRELLRNQTFAILNVPLGTGAEAMGVEEAKALIGGTTGTENVMFSALAADYISPDASNVQVYQSEIDRLLRRIYRLAAISWEADSRDAEATGSLKIKREDMNQQLARMADELEQADYAVADLFYRAMYGATAGPAKMEADNVVIRYPETFDVAPFDELLAQAQAALALDFPPVFWVELLKRLVVKFLPDLPDHLVQDVNEAIEQEVPAAAQAKKDATEALRQRLAQGQGQGEEPEPGDGQGAAAEE